jgi:membrane protein
MRATRARVPVLLMLVPRAVAAWWNDDILRLGASVAYYTLFAIAPILLIAIALAGAVFGDEAVRGEIVGQIDGLVGRDGGAAVQALVEGARRRDTGALAATMGALTSLLAACAVFLELQAALNAVWRVRPAPPASLVRSFVISRAQSFGVVLAIGFLLLVSLASSAALAGLGAWLSARVPGAETAVLILDWTLSLAVTAGLFTLLFKVLPDVELAWSDVAIGGVVTAMLFTLGKYGIGAYLGSSSTASSYGAIGSVLVLLLWVYYSAQILLIGAEFTRLYTERTTGHRPAPTPLARPS